MISKILLLLSLIIPTAVYAELKQTGELIKAKDWNESTLVIGTVQQSILTLAQFQSLQGSCWRLLDGSSIAGTDLGTLTGLTNLPNATQGGSFIRQASGTRVLGSYEDDALQDHRHNWFLGQGAGSSAPYGSAWGANNTNYSFYISRSGNIGPATGARVDDETRPKNIALNYFIKVNKSCN